VSIFPIEFSFSFNIVLSIIVSVDVIIAGDERHRWHRRWIGWDDFIDDNCNVQIDLPKLGVTAVNDSVDKELLLFLFNCDWWRYWYWETWPPPPPP